MYFYRQIRTVLTEVPTEVWFGIHRDNYYFKLLDGRRTNDVSLLYNWAVGQPQRGDYIVAAFLNGAIHDYEGGEFFFGICEKAV